MVAGILRVRSPSLDKVRNRRFSKQAAQPTTLKSLLRNGIHHPSYNRTQRQENWTIGKGISANNNISQKKSTKESYC